MTNYEVRPEYIPTNKASFNIENVDKFVIDHGAYTIWEKSFLCPCRNANTTSPTPNCPRCQGTGFSYYEAKSTLVMYQSQEKGVTNADISLTHAGTAIGTSTKEDKIAFRDRLTVSESTIPQSVLVYVSEKSVEHGIYLRYNVEEVVYACTDESELDLLTFRVEDNIYYPDASLIGQYVSVNILATLRYYVVDILREARYQYNGDPRKVSQTSRVNSFIGLNRKLLLRREDMYIPDVLTDTGGSTQEEIDLKVRIDRGLGGFFEQNQEDTNA